MENLILGALVFVPLLFTYFWKSNAGVAFLSLCAGFTLSSFVAWDIQNLLKTLNFGWVSQDAISFALLSLPLALSLLLVRASHSKGLLKPKFLLQIIAALGTGAFFAVQAQKYLNVSSNSGIWHSLERAQPLAIGAGAAASLLLTWLGGFSRHSRHHR